MDREKVINGLRCIKGDLILCVDCAYSDENGHGTYSCKAFCANDAISLLKEQEAVVHPEPSCEMTYITDCCCDLCGVQLIREDNFCRCCGKRIEWEGR